VSYTVEWSERALEDLVTKVRTRRVAEELHRVAAEALNDHSPPDGGQTEHGSVYWRRGLTVRQRSALESAETGGRDCDGLIEQAWDFLLVYKRRNGFGTWRIIAVERLDDINEGLAKLGDVQPGVPVATAEK